MKTEWDYTGLATAYTKRPDYAEDAIDRMLEKCGAGPGSQACDIGAGVGHLTIMLANRGVRVVAIEPNDDMRRLGVERCRDLKDVVFIEAAAERTGQAEGVFDLVTFGSSFNVTDRPRALAETARLLKARGWFGAMWNHRDLNDPIQAAIERIIKDALPGYGYGSRREDQTNIIDQSGLFGPVERIEGLVRHSQAINEVVEAWRSHATLQRQAGDKFNAIIERISGFLASTGGEAIEIPYTTRIWIAQKRS